MHHYGSVLFTGSVLFRGPLGARQDFILAVRSEGGQQTTYGQEQFIDTATSRVAGIIIYASEAKCYTAEPL